MKIVKSKLSIAIMSIGFVGVIGAISFASLNRTPDLRKSEPKSAVDKRAALGKLAKSLKETAKLAPHQDDIEAYLESMKGFLQTPPRDGVFGGDRIPTLHGKESDDLESFKGIVSLEGQLQLRSAVVGLFSHEDMKSRSEGVSKKGHKLDSLTKEDTVRVTDVHLLAPDRADNDDSASKWNAGTAAIKKFALTARAKGQETYAEEVEVDGKPSWIIAKAVHASVNSCYKCHANIKRGEAIGYTVALVSTLKPGEKSSVHKDDI